MVSLQAFGTPHSIFFKPAESSFTSHFPAAMLHMLTVYTSYKPQVPELNSGSLGNPKSLTPSSALPSQSLWLWWLRQQNHIPLLTHANNTRECVVMAATKRMIFFFSQIEQIPTVSSQQIITAKKEVKDTVIISLNCCARWDERSSLLHIRILSTTQLQESCPIHVGTTSPQNQQRCLQC